MTYTISKDFAFSAAHHLEGLPEGHKCARVHGHNYVVRVVISAPAVDEVGFVVDYDDLKPIGELIDDDLDHRDLNEVFGFNPTAENMARSFVHDVRELVPLPEQCTVAVGVSETPKVWAWFHEADQ